MFPSVDPLEPKKTNLEPISSKDEIKPSKSEVVANKILPEQKPEFDVSPKQIKNIKKSNDQVAAEKILNNDVGEYEILSYLQSVGNLQLLTKTLKKTMDSPQDASLKIASINQFNKVLTHYVTFDKKLLPLKQRIVNLFIGNGYEEAKKLLAQGKFRYAQDAISFDEILLAPWELKIPYISSRLDALLLYDKENRLKLAENLIKDYGQNKSYPESLKIIQVLYNSVIDETENVQEKAAIQKKILSKIQFPQNHPLYDLKKVSKTPSDRMPHSGNYLSDMGSAKVRRGHVHLVTKKINGKQTLQVNIKLTNHTRREIQQKINQIKNNFDAYSTNWEGLVISNPNFDYYPVDDKDNFHTHGSDFPLMNNLGFEISAKNLGRIKIGMSLFYSSLFETVTIELPSDLPPGEALKRTHALLALIGLEDAISPNSGDDTARLGLLQLFRSFFPSKAFDLENDPTTYKLSPDELITKIFEKAPEARSVFKKYLKDEPDTFAYEEVSPGQFSFVLKDQGERLREKGLFGLVMGVRITGGFEETGYDNIVDIVKFGALSSTKRWERGIGFNTGFSPEEDALAGSIDYVFTRGVTKNMADQLTMHQFNQNAVHLLIDADALEKGGFGYDKDRWGFKNRYAINDDRYQDYKNRKPLEQLVTHLDNRKADDVTKNEIMIPQEIPPHHIRGIVVKDEKQKKIFLDKFRQQKMIENINGVEMIKGKPVDQFIIISEGFKKEMWDKPQTT